MTARQLLSGLAACLALVGCQDPYADSAGRRTEPLQRAEEGRAKLVHGDELAPRGPAVDSALAYRQGAARRSPRGVLEAFCSQWVNWSWRTIGRQQQRLAGLATGRLAEQLAAQGRPVGLDRALRRDRLSISGRIVAIDVSPAGAPGRAVCVTREQEVQNGRGELAGGRHRVYLATLDQGAQGWGVSRWEPQP